MVLDSSPAQIQVSENSQKHSARKLIERHSKHYELDKERRNCKTRLIKRYNRKKPLFKPRQLDSEPQGNVDLTHDNNKSLDGSRVNSRNKEDDKTDHLTSSRQKGENAHKECCSKLPCQSRNDRSSEKSNVVAVTEAERSIFSLKPKSKEMKNEPSCCSRIKDVTVLAGRPQGLKSNYKSKLKSSLDLCSHIPVANRHLPSSHYKKRPNTSFVRMENYKINQEIRVSRPDVSAIEKENRKKYSNLKRRKLKRSILNEKKPFSPNHFSIKDDTQPTFTIESIRNLFGESTTSTINNENPVKTVLRYRKRLTENFLADLSLKLEDITETVKEGEKVRANREIELQNDLEMKIADVTEIMTEKRKLLHNKVLDLRTENSENTNHRMVITFNKDRIQETSKLEKEMIRRETMIDDGRGESEMKDVSRKEQTANCYNSITSTSSGFVSGSTFHVGKLTKNVEASSAVEVMLGKKAIDECIATTDVRLLNKQLIKHEINTTLAFEDGFRNIKLLFGNPKELIIETQKSTGDVDGFELNQKPVISHEDVYTEPDSMDNPLIETPHCETVVVNDAENNTHVKIITVELSTPNSLTVLYEASADSNSVASTASRLLTEELDQAYSFFPRWLIELFSNGDCSSGAGDVSSDQMNDGSGEDPGSTRQGRSLFDVIGDEDAGGDVTPFTVHSARHLTLTTHGEDDVVDKSSDIRMESEPELVEVESLVEENILQNHGILGIETLNGENNSMLEVQPHAYFNNLENIPTLGIESWVHKNNLKMRLDIKSQSVKNVLDNNSTENSDFQVKEDRHSVLEKSLPLMKLNTTDFNVDKVNIKDVNKSCKFEKDHIKLFINVKEISTDEKKNSADFSVDQDVQFKKNVHRIVPEDSTINNILKTPCFYEDPQPLSDNTMNFLKSGTKSSWNELEDLNSFKDIIYVEKKYVFGKKIIKYDAENENMYESNVNNLNSANQTITEVTMEENNHITKNYNDARNIDAKGFLKIRLNDICIRKPSESIGTLLVENEKLEKFCIKNINKELDKILNKPNELENPVHVNLSNEKVTKEGESFTEMSTQGKTKRTETSRPYVQPLIKKVTTLKKINITPSKRCDESKTSNATNELSNEGIVKKGVRRLSSASKSDNGARQLSETDKGTYNFSSAKKTEKYTRKILCTRKTGKSTCKVLDPCKTEKDTSNLIDANKVEKGTLKSKELSRKYRSQQSRDTSDKPKQVCHIMRNYVQIIVKDATRD